MRAVILLVTKTSTRETEPTISTPRAAIALAVVAALLATVRAAGADQQYDVNGQDVYSIGSSGAISRVVYAGTQRLTIERQGKRARFDAQVRYQRAADDGKSSVDARFVQELLPNGSFQDLIDDDPDFLTILNQPFAVQLDGSTMRDLRALHKAVPFDATSPLGGEAVLRGFLRPGLAGEVGGRPVIAVRFEAEGPMTGPVPQRSQATMTGRMRMDGTAYYSTQTSMLLALDATLTIVASLRDADRSVPVKIVYRRSIRASQSAATAVAAPVKTPLPAPLASGGGTAPPGSR